MYPETYIIDRKGKIARKVIGAGRIGNSAEMVAYFDALLGAKLSSRVPGPYST